MPIGTTPAYNGPYTANGATTVFPFTFKVLSTSQVSVINRVSGVDSTVSSGLYTVTLSGSSPSSGSVVFNTAPASGQIYVLLSPEFSQDIEFADGAAWIAKPVNDGYDQSALRDQALRRDLGRAQLVPVGETAGTLPVASARAGKYLAYDANGDPAMSSGTGADSGLRADLASSGGAALVGLAGGGTVQDALYAATPEMYGAVGDGVTDDTAAITAAVAASAALYWADKTYLTTASIPGFHSVAHYGPGIVKRGVTLFYVFPSYSQSNTLYVSAGAASGADGLATTQPMPLAEALTALDNYGPTLRGKWNIVGAAGTYSGNLVYPIGLRSEFPVVITGPTVGYPNVPTMLIDGGGTASACIRARRDGSIYFKDIKFQNTTGAGIAMIDGFLATENVHTDYCGRGIDLNRTTSYVGSGIFVNRTGTDICYSSLFVAQHTIGFTYNIDTGLAPACLGIQMKYLGGGKGSKGVFLQESVTGHVENVTFEDFFRGIEVNSSARAHVANCNFKRCTIGVQAGEGCNVFNSANTFNMSTADACTNAFFFESGAVETNSYSNSMGDYIVKQTGAPTTPTVTGTTGEVTVQTYASFLDGSVFSNRGKIVVIVRGTMTGTAGTKALRARMGGVLMGGNTFSAGTSGSFRTEITMDCTGTNTQSVFAISIAPGETKVDDVPRTLTLASGTAQDLTVTGQLGSAADSITITYIEVRRGGA